MAARMAAGAHETALEKFDIDKLHARLEAMILAASGRPAA